MSKVIVEFTLNGRKHTYYRRKSMFGEAITTTNKNSAKRVDESDVTDIIKLLKKQYKENVDDIGVIPM